LTRYITVSKGANVEAILTQWILVNWCSPELSLDGAVKERDVGLRRLMRYLLRFLAGQVANLPNCHC
jgi:hypothetical protein